MNILDDASKVVSINSIQESIDSDFYWILNLSIMDYSITPLVVLEETTCPSFVVDVGGHEVTLPASWNMLIYDTETGDVDLIPLCEMTGRSFTALGFGPKCALAKPLPVKIMDYKTYHTNVSPSLNKHQMLCVPISDELWFTVSSVDVYSKYFKNVSLGDIIQ